MSILEKINTSNDVKQLKPEELAPLCAEIRSFLIESVSKTGGHLASNLGTVELTVALHRVYDSARDRIVFDVGHQSYTHKILTGRRESFSTLRQFGGISGFPKPYEAEDDAFIAGHASNSVSVALGMAHARTLSGEDYDVCAVIGDGAMTGGLSFEGLSNAAQSGEAIVVILNDNNMSGHSQSYGGNAYGGLTAAYGSIKQPFDPGMGARSQGDQNNKIAAIGGGAIKLTVTGALTLDGSIVALGTADQNIARSGGTGGSIWISASQISGTGRIDASAPTGIGNDQIVSVGSGGRIALYTQSPLAFPMANVACSGTGYKGTSWAWNTRVSGPGTIYVYDPAQTNGTLYVKQSADVSTTNTKWTGAPVMGDLELDAVVLSGRASLRIPAGTSLTLPSLSAVTTDNTSAGVAGLVCAGGTLNIGNGDQTLKANVAFSSPTAFAFPGDLTLETGAKLGSLYSLYGTAAADYDQTCRRLGGRQEQLRPHGRRDGTSHRRARRPVALPRGRRADQWLRLRPEPVDAGRFHDRQFPGGRRLHADGRRDADA